MADLQIDSNQVSREHAVITRHGKKFRVRDLGSTNGTFVNGEQIEQATLNDGDLLVIAEVELTFFCGGGGAGRQTATQPISSEPFHSHHQGSAAWDTILAVRRTHEVVTQRCLRTLFQPIVELTGGSVFGYEAFATSGADGTANSRCEQLAVNVDCRATDRMRQLFRRLAVEDAQSLPHGGRLLLAITATECGSPALVGQLCQLRDALGERWQIGVEIPDAAVHNTADFRALLASLRDEQIQVAYDGCASSKAQIIERKDVAPDFLKLVPSMFRSIHRGEDRQRQVQFIVRASHDVGCTVIATGIDTQADLNVCRDIGCTLAQGGQFGQPQSLAALIESSRSSGPAQKPVK